jgi:hypothetical protein
MQKGCKKVVTGLFIDLQGRNKLNTAITGFLQGFTQVQAR